MAKKPARMKEPEEMSSVESDPYREVGMDQPSLGTSSPPTPPTNMNAVDHIQAAVANLKANAPDQGLSTEHQRAILKLEAAERMIHASK